MNELLPAARLADVLRGDAALIGSRLDRDARRGMFSPIEARVHLGIPYGDLRAEEAARLERRTLRSDAGTIGRALVGRALAPGAPRRIEARPFIVAARVDDVPIETAVTRILAPPPSTRARMVHFVHPHALNVAALDAALAARYRDADLVLPDGIGLRIAARVTGSHLTHNVNGTDLLPLLCTAAAAAGVRLALVGAAPGVAEGAAENLVRRFGIRVALVSHGFLDASEARAVRDRLGALPGTLVLVAMGTPVQERWAWRHLARVPRITVVTVGGLFDFYAGRVARAPAVWRETGLEWLWRTVQEPRRLALRYLVGNPVFLGLAALQALRARS